MLNIFRFLFPKKPKQYDFILTKKYKNNNGQDKGDLVLRVEHVIENTYQCSKGRFEIENGELVYKFASQRLISLSLLDIHPDSPLPIQQAYKMLEKRINRIK